jgi:TrmH family RNA methyltransferase
MLLGTPEFLAISDAGSGYRIEEVPEKELGGLGEFQTSTSAVAVAKMKPNKPLSIVQDEYVLILDDIRDPGNLGTIIRTADWYGITKIVASSETADFYNPKVINSTMGSFTRTSIFYTELADFLASAKGQAVYGAYLEGQNIYKTTFARGGFIVIGNESRGISEKLEPFISQKITIPRFGNDESLNAAIATAVILDNIRRSRQ